MDFSWLDPTNPLHQVLIGGAGNALANVAGKTTNSLIGALSGKLRSRFQSPLPSTAVRDALAYALVETISLVSTDVAEFEKLLRRFDAWLSSDEVINEFSEYLLAPAQQGELNLDLLKAEFGKAGFNPDQLGDGRNFDEIVTTLADKFCIAAATQSALKGVIDTDLLRQTVTKLEQLRRASQKQTGVLKQIQQTLQAFHPLDLGTLEKAYLRKLYKTCNDLPLARDKRDDPNDGGPRLQRVFVEVRTHQAPTPEAICDRLAIPASQRQRALNLLKREFDTLLEGSVDKSAIRPTAIPRSLREITAERIEKLEKDLQLKKGNLSAVLDNLTPAEVLQQFEQIVILGDPGSGKSTLTQRLAGLFAAATCDEAELLDELGEEEIADLQALLKTMGRRLLPVHIVLNRWAQHLVQTTPSPTSRKGVANDLIDQCVRLVGEAGYLGERQKERFIQRLSEDTPPTALLLLDGLDEVTDPILRKFILEAISDFHASHARVPLIVTCRVRPYRAWRAANQALPLLDFELAPLTPQSIEQFAQRWHSELLRAGIYSAEKAAAAQQRLLTALKDKSRGELDVMASTPLLLTMMVRVNYHNPLPDSRAELYDLFVNQLLYEWEKRKLDDPAKPTGLEELLSQANVTAGSLQQALNEVAYAIHDRARGDTVDIPRNTLRDALEFIHPGNEEQKVSWATKVLRLIADRSGLINAVDATVGHEIYKFSHRSFQEYLAAQRLATGERYLTRFEDKIDNPNWREAILLAIGYQVFVQKPAAYGNVLTVLDELLLGRLPSAPDDEAGWRRFLLLSDAYVHLLTPQRAGEADEKVRAQKVITALPDLLRNAMQNRALPPRTRLDAGLLLSDLDIDPPGLDDFILIPGTAVHIGRYPVTNKQFRRFVKAGGYDTLQWWSEEGWRYKTERAWREPLDSDDNQFNHNAHPVVGISWYEAEAYCSWLTENPLLYILAEVSELPGEKKWQVRLPSEEEWMAAARNGQSATQDDKEDYPWRGKFEVWRANTGESGLQQTTPVDMYPDGVSQGDVWDLSGNVYEWVDNGDLVKGGCWAFYQSDAITVARDESLRWDGWNFSGFRCVVVPISR